MRQKTTAFAMTLFITIVVSMTGLFSTNVHAAPQIRVIDNTDVIFSLPLYPQMLEPWFKDFKSKAVISTGTNGRFDAFIQKLMNGEQVIIVANGGSITEGSGASSIDNSYADRVVYGLKTRFPKAQIEYLNVGISAQPSSIGIMNYDRDVTFILGNRVPDLVLIEYAVNDAVDPTNGAGYESMVRKAIENPDTAVMLIFSMFKSEYTNQERYQLIGENYGLPMVSVKNALLPYSKDGLINYNYYFWDSMHPSDFGHFLMSECILEAFDQKYEQIKAKNILPLNTTLPSSIFGAKGTHMTLATKNFGYVSNQDGTVGIIQGNPSGVQIDSGSFSGTDNELRESRRFDSPPFFENYMHYPESGSAPMIISADCKEIYINYKTTNNPEYGSITLYVDDEYAGKISGYDTDGFGNSTLYVVNLGSETQRHSIRIQMDTNDLTKKFTIYNFAFIQ